MAAILEAKLITSCGNQSCCRNWACTFNLANALAPHIREEEVLDPTIVSREPAIQFGQFVADAAQHINEDVPNLALMAIGDFTEARRIRVISRATTTPCFPSALRTWFTSRVRFATTRWRIRWTACISNCPAGFGGTKRIDGLPAASPIASASLRSFLFDFTQGFTNCGEISLTSRPKSVKTRAQ